MARACLTGNGRGSPSSVTSVRFQTCGEKISANRGTTWLALTIGACLLTLLTVLGAVLLLQFLANRPVDLRLHSDYFAKLFEESLQENLVPTRHINRIETVPKADELGLWNFHHYQVAVPPTLDPEGLIQVVSSQFSPYGLEFARVPDADSDTWQLGLGSRVFLEVDLEQAAMPPTEKLDLRPVAERLAADLRDVLLHAGATPDQIKNIGVTEREDNLAKWTLTRLSARLPASLTPQSLAATLREQSAVTGLETIIAPKDEDEALLLLLFDDRECVQLHCTFQPPPAEMAGDSEPAAPAAESSPPSATPQPAAPVESSGIVEVAPLTAEAPGGPPPEAKNPEAQEEAKTEPQTEKTPAESGLPKLDDLPLENIESLEIPTEEEALAPPGPRVEEPRVAIILDDGGYGGRITDKVLSLDPGLTLAVLPNTPHAEDTATRATAAGFEVMLHMPMEARNAATYPFPGQLLRGMSADDIRKLTTDAIAQIPGIAGVNNHQGSAFTEDTAAMETFLSVLASNDLYFVDSRTISGSVGLELAAEAGIPAAGRDIFLDNVQDAEYIREQFSELAKKARTRGVAIGIGHFRALTADVLEEELPRLKEQGIQLVHISELLK